MRNCGYINITSELLKEKLDVSKDYSINGITYDPFNDTVQILLSGSDLPVITEGNSAPQLDYLEVTTSNYYCIVDGNKYVIDKDHVGFLKAIELMRKGKCITRVRSNKVYRISPMTNRFNVVATYLNSDKEEKDFFFSSDDVISNDWLVLKKVSKQDTTKNDDKVGI